MYPSWWLSHLFQKYRLQIGCFFQGWKYLNPKINTYIYIYHMDRFLSNKTKPQAVFWVISNKIKLDEVKWPPSSNQQSGIERPPKIPKLETNKCFDWLKLKKSPVKSTPGPKKNVFLTRFLEVGSSVDPWEIYNPPKKKLLNGSDCPKNVRKKNTNKDIGRIDSSWYIQYQYGKR